MPARREARDYYVTRRDTGEGLPVRATSAYGALTMASALPGMAGAPGYEVRAVVPVRRRPNGEQEG